MELVIGPFDPVAHVLARDHYQAVRREAALLDAGPSSPPVRYGALIGELYQGLGLGPVTEAVDRAFVAGEAAFSATVELPDEAAPELLRTCQDLAAVLAELDGWGRQQGGELLVAPEPVRAYQQAFLAQVHAQLAAAADPGPEEERWPANRG